MSDELALSDRDAAALKAMQKEEAVPDAPDAESAQSAQAIEQSAQETAQTAQQPDVSRETSAQEPAKAEPEPSTVPYAALKEERERRKAAEKERQAERERLAELQGRLRALEQAIPQPQGQQQQPKGPADPIQQPIEALQELVQFRNETVQREQGERQFAAFRGAYLQKAQEFTATTPDFKEAYDFAMQNRIQELQALGYDQATAGQIAQNNEIEIVAKAFQDGANPAERLYAVAKMRGYQKPAPAAQGDDSAARAAAALEKSADKLATIARGQAAGRSLSSSGGASNDQIDAQALAEMSEEDFAKISPTTWRKLMGG